MSRAKTHREFGAYAPALLALSLLGLGCTGAILGESAADPADSAAGPLPSSMTTGGQGSAGSASAPMGVTVLHRLNKVELHNTVVQLFGESASAALRDGVDPLVQGFDSNADALTISESGVDSLMRMAGELSAGLDLTAALPCGARSGRACAEQRISSMALRLLRRPARAEETSSYLALWDEVAGRTNEDTAMRAVLQRLMMTPDFLYHVEVGDETGLLDNYELAARLSFFAVESTPDDALLEAARSGALQTAEGLATELDRLLADPRGQAAFGRFFEQWAELGKLAAATKDKSVYPEFDGLKAPMGEEFKLFTGDLLAHDGTVKDLLTSPSTFVNGDLGALYGVAAPGSAFQSVSLPAGQRAGILMQSAFLASHGKANKSAPILRGRFIRDQLLCAPLPPPPPDANKVEPNAAVPTTTREYYQQLTSAPTCAACHEQLNPLGFAFEGFDGIGRARSDENGHPLDTTGAITAGDAAGPVTNAFELVTRLGDSATVRTCLVKQMFRSRFRRVEVGGDEALIQSVASALTSGGDRLKSLPKLLAGEAAMRRRHFRVVASGESAL